MKLKHLYISTIHFIFQNKTQYIIQHDNIFNVIPYPVYPGPRYKRQKKKEKKQTRHKTTHHITIIIIIVNLNSFGGDSGFRRYVSTSSSDSYLISDKSSVSISLYPV